VLVLQQLFKLSKEVLELQSIDRKTFEELSNRE